MVDDVKMEAQGISFSWEGMPVLRDISFQVETGNLACLIGKSGVGKTTLFHILAGLEAPDRGRILIDGQDETARPGKVSYMLQKDLLFESRTVLDNVCLPLLMKGVQKKEARQRASELFPLFGIDGYQDKYPSQISGGMKQRGALLRTYLMENDVILLDEPFSALDAITRIELREWFVDVMEQLGLTGVLITHDVEEALALGDKVMVLGKPNEKPEEGSTIVSSIDIDVPKEDRAGFLLTDDALEIKRELLHQLGMREA